ncbi:hypothetical protein SO694_00115094 [Aureococcus anophagefferens]|uniref:Uncharacterized protein n=1 Tax=Aureococcus anophagefferens TaxID=44056 RepID=A0ABR1FWY0_AURAN
MKGTNQSERCRWEFGGGEAGAGEIAEVSVKNMEYFHRQQKLKKGRGADGRVEFIPALKFEGRMKGYYFGGGGESSWGLR